MAGKRLRRRGRHGAGPYIGQGPMIAVIAFTVLAAIVISAGLCMQARDSRLPGVRESTADRDPIRPYGEFDRDCVDDRAGWIGDMATLLFGMEEFYNKTGVQPALCVTADLDGKDPEDFASDEYDRLVGHERGVLLVFYEPSPADWDAYYMAGMSAQSVMDQEACGILTDLAGYYYDGDMPEDEYFAAVFRETAGRIM